MPYPISVGFKMTKLNRCRKLSNKKYHRSFLTLIMKLVLFLKNNNTKIRNTSTTNLPVNNNLKMIIYKNQKDREIIKAIQS